MKIIRLSYSGLHFPGFDIIPINATAPGAYPDAIAAIRSKGINTPRHCFQHMNIGRVFYRMRNIIAAIRKGTDPQCVLKRKKLVYLGK